MNKLKRKIAILLMCLIPVSSCEVIPDIIDIIMQIISETGWLADQEEMDNIPEDITPFDDDSKNLKPQADLSKWFPPIGDQGSYGTCVAWAVGYNLKTALNAIENAWLSNDLANQSNQVSPQDLWWSIPTSKRGSNCNGTNFEPALDAIIAKGVESLATVPYTKTVNCTKTTGGNPNNKLANYRKIASENEGLTPENFKGYLDAGRPIAFGARLGDRFMSWKSSSIIDYDTYNNPGMQHAYHAMALVGYDDSKRAFRVRNSWGTSWGDNGSIWVDYTFFCKSFCFAAFVAQNPNVISVGAPQTGYDLLALFADDYPYSDDDKRFTRTFEYEVYNSGTQTITPSQKWTVTYMYYNANKASEYEIIYDDYYTNEFGKEEGDYGFWDDARGLVGGYWNNITLPREETVGGDFEINYNMPKITGNYYLVLMADAYDVIRETNEDNNFYFITAENGKPLIFRDGVITNKPAGKSTIKNASAEKRPGLFANTENQTAVVPGNLNAYTPAEIQTMLIHDKKNGKLELKRKAYSEKEKNHERRRKVDR